jgi:hypothetical protein
LQSVKADVQSAPVLSAQLSNKNETGGRFGRLPPLCDKGLKNERYHYSCLCRVQTAELYDDQEQEKYPKETRIQKILPVLQNTYSA